MFIWWILLVLIITFTIAQVVGSNLIYRLKELSRSTKVILGSIGFVNNFILTPIVVITIIINFKENQTINIFLISLLVTSIIFFIIEKALKKKSIAKTIIEYFTKYSFNVIPIATTIYFFTLLI